MASPRLAAFIRARGGAARSYAQNHPSGQWAFGAPLSALSPCALGAPHHIEGRRERAHAADVVVVVGGGARARINIAIASARAPLSRPASLVLARSREAQHSAPRPPPAARTLSSSSTAAPAAFKVLVGQWYYYYLLYLLCAPSPERERVCVCVRGRVREREISRAGVRNEIAPLYVYRAPDSIGPRARARYVIGEEDDAAGPRPSLSLLFRPLSLSLSQALARAPPCRRWWWCWPRSRPDDHGRQVWVDSYAVAAVLLSIRAILFTLMCVCTPTCLYVLYPHVWFLANADRYTCCLYNMYMSHVQPRADGALASIHPFPSMHRSCLLLLSLLFTIYIYIFFFIFGWSRA